MIMFEGSNQSQTFSKKKSELQIFDWLSRTCSVPQPVQKKISALSRNKKLKLCFKKSIE
jgi:hypothetical protein